jgi:hypothetical protein
VTALVDGAFLPGDWRTNFVASRVVTPYDHMRTDSPADAQPAALRCAALLPLILSAVVTTGAAQREGKPPDLKPYPGAVELCGGSVTGAPGRDGRPGGHILWTTYYSVEPSATGAAHYLHLLGTQNHRKEGGEDIWRFPLDKPLHVLTVAPAPGKPPSPSCKAPPTTARAVIEISSMFRP